MVTNFENITKELTNDEIRMYIQPLFNGFKTHTIQNPIKADIVCQKMNAYLTNRYGGRCKYFSGAKLRKCVNYIRSKGLLPIIATNKGYYTSTDKKQIKSLEERANSIRKCAQGLKKFL